MSTDLPACLRAEAACCLLPLPTPGPPTPGPPSAALRWEPVLPSQAAPR